MEEKAAVAEPPAEDSSIDGEAEARETDVAGAYLGGPAPSFADAAEAGADEEGSEGYDDEAYPEEAAASEQPVDDEDQEPFVQALYMPFWSLGAIHSMPRSPWPYCELHPSDQRPSW